MPSHMGDSRAQEPPPWCALAATAVVGAPGVDELQQSRGQRLLDAPVRERGPPQRPLLLHAVPVGMVVVVRGVARQARGRGAAGEQDEVDAVHHGVAAGHPLARTAEGLLPLSAFESFKKDDALRQLCKGGSDDSRTLSLHHLTCRVHEPVECARPLLEVDQGHSITTVLDDGRDQLTKEQLYVMVQIHSTRHIELLLSGNAHTNVWLLDEFKSNGHRAAQRKIFCHIVKPGILRQ